MADHPRPALVLFDDIDYRDTKSLYQARDLYLREGFVRRAELNTVRKALLQCYHTLGVNHFEDCRELAELYLTMIRTHQVMGPLGYQKYDPSK